MFFDSAKKKLEEAEAEIQEALSKITREETLITMEQAIGRVPVGSYKNSESFMAFVDPGVTSGSICTTSTAVCPEGYRSINAKEFLVVAAKIGNIVGGAGVDIDEFWINMPTQIPTDTDKRFHPDWYPAYWYHDSEGHRFRLSTYHQEPEDLQKERPNSVWLWVENDDA